MELKIYAPCNGSTTKLEDLKDGVFSEKLLGDGIVFYPEESMFYSPLEKGTLLQVFDTKHAYFFKSTNFENAILMHIGLDTVKLKGKPFELLSKEKKNVNKKSSIVKVDLEYIKKENISIATPITISGEYQYELKDLNIGEVKKGDLLYTIVFEKTNVEEIKNNATSIVEFKSKYLLAAEQFLVDIGGESNYKDVYNCMTRLRFSIIDKAKVDTKNISKNKLVKGVVWNGLELQIIIGGECYKVKDEILNLKNKVSNIVVSKDKILKPPLSRRMLGVVTGIMAPNVPIILASGILSALYALLAATKAIDTSNDANMFSTIMKILSKTGLLLVGIFFCMNTIKYLGGNILLGALLGLILVSRFYFQTGTSDSDLYKFGTYIQDKNYHISGWYLFSIGDFPVAVKSYEGSILPFIFVGFLGFYVDKWIKTWMPSTIDVVFRYPLVIIITIVPTLFGLGPILSLIEIGVAKAIGFIEKWPIGLGVGIFALIIQPLVIMGVHVAVYVTLQVPLLSGDPTAASLILPGGQAAVWGQIGAAIGVLIMTKNWNFKSVILGTLPSAAFGITETILYGVNIPKGRPFAIGCVAGAVGGIVMGSLGAKLRRLVGDGILYPMGLDGLDQLWFVIGSLVSLITAILLTVFLYRERIDEKRYAIKISSKVKRFITNIFVDAKNKYNKNLDSLNKEFISCKKEFNDYEKYLQKITKIENRLLKLEQKEEIKRKKLFEAIKRLESKTSQSSIDKKNDLISLYNQFSLEKEKLKLNLEKQEITNTNKLVIKTYQEKIKDLDSKVANTISILEKETNLQYLNNFKNGYWNATHTVDISYGYEDMRLYGFSKSEKKEIKNLKLQGVK
ncbi:glucose PTS transporter subunit IIA [Spiroplasma tabanidicola]|uniref:PTS system, beta-glucoside-specific IIA component n=1 Tax=Spiroplasma tabanidicola TaxID=324079 RepID=A0A6I6C5K0_9MOLU|nr:glucose PTS transporter subunit IIA [Spiroplasma tabanidicola]QGS51410.1 PTS system, beta-glucoside-specific IIA component [Spiroplasma tabanidicola]